MTLFAVHFDYFELARLPNREVKDVPEWRVRGLLHELNVVFTLSILQRRAALPPLKD